MADLMYLIAFLDDTPEGSFELNNLEDAKHVTIVPEFSVPNNCMNDVRIKFDRAASWFGEISINAISESIFGETENPIPVVEITGHDANNNSILNLHSTLASIIYQSGGSCSSPQYCFNNFAPHISYMGMFAETLRINCFSLIHHRDGFGRNVINLRNYFLNDSL